MTDPRDYQTRTTYVPEPCPLCDEPVTWIEVIRGGLRMQRIGGLGGGRLAHGECLLRESLGGIGHLENHGYWCTERHDPDGGRSLRQSALEVDEWVRAHGIDAAVKSSALDDMTRAKAVMDASSPNWWAAE